MATPCPFCAEPFDGLARYQLKASLEFAHDKILLIQETKRARKVKA